MSRRKNTPTPGSKKSISRIAPETLDRASLSADAFYNSKASAEFQISNELHRLSRQIRKLNNSVEEMLLGLPVLTQWRLRVVRFLRAEFPNESIDVNRMGHLPDNLRETARDYLKASLPNSLQKNNLIKEVLRNPRKKGIQYESEFRVGRIGADE